MKPIRTFIAIELSEEARTALSQLQNRLKPLVPPRSVRWTAPQNIHLTLHFLGNVAESDIDKISEAISQAAAASQPLTLSLQGLGCFPNLKRPRVLWVGVGGDMERLVPLHQELGQRLAAAIDFSPDKRPYSPHLTIGRVKKGTRSGQLSQLGQLLEREQARVGELARLAVTEISLIRSDLQPSGPIYTVLSQGKLTDQ